MAMISPSNLFLRQYPVTVRAVRASGQRVDCLKSIGSKRKLPKLCGGTRGVAVSKTSCPSETRSLGCPHVWEERNPRNATLLISDLTIRVAQFLCQSRSCSISRQSPDILRFLVTKQVTVAVVHAHSKGGRARSIPAILDRHTLPHSLSQLPPHSPLLPLITAAP